MFRYRNDRWVIFCACRTENNELVGVGTWFPHLVEVVKKKKSHHHQVILRNVIHITIAIKSELSKPLRVRNSFACSYVLIVPLQWHVNLIALLFLFAIHFILRSIQTVSYLITPSAFISTFMFSLRFLLGKSWDYKVLTRQIKCMCRLNSYYVL